MKEKQTKKNLHSETDKTKERGVSKGQQHHEKVNNNLEQNSPKNLTPKDGAGEQTQITGNSGRKKKRLVKEADKEQRVRTVEEENYHHDALKLEPDHDLKQEDIPKVEAPKTQVDNIDSAEKSNQENSNISSQSSSEELYNGEANEIWSSDNESQNQHKKQKVSELEDSNLERNDKRYQTYLLMIEDFKRNHSIKESNINIDEIADQLENLVYEKCSKRVIKKYWKLCNWISENIKILADYPLMIEQAVKKKLDLQTFFLDKLYFRNKWIEISNKLTKKVSVLKKKEEIKQASSKSHISNNYLIYANLINSASSGKNDQSNSISKLSSIWSAEQCLKPITKYSLYGDFNISNEDKTSLPNTNSSKNLIN